MATLRHAWGGFPGEDGSQGVKVQPGNAKNKKSFGLRDHGEDKKHKNKSPFLLFEFFEFGWRENWELEDLCPVCQSIFLISYRVSHLFYPYHGTRLWGVVDLVGAIFSLHFLVYDGFPCFTTIRDRASLSERYQDLGFLLFSIPVCLCIL